ncbi:hypothetical protein KC332_g18063 [Hortaea werneckii]|uniref:CID domain-containing protein n=2 Tax=Hortaea werneckii TaxID=91943 RepID=A0A3M7I092_HORWE|nr:hypothetical protein KC358_g18249 [Hortaea werneckii]OTA32471.1 hypothetical protein BTJ68_06272 [Hortaea werneckii EXF-2000]KAI6789532.1 hypothetical protein KC350_g18204 [Hortaea werneckii]KAI6895848.1 hypothetical protein KC348_g18154 [Hortaea werneckii]KAI6917964.1 hypothetical protein KC341_g18205 [Hortaea werneckii]
MAVNILHELDQQLASLNQLKPPGASKGKIGSITALCVSNIQAESNIVQSLYRALKKAPATHKLGALYVIDSVVRQWIEAAKRNGQDLNIEGRGEPGTYNAAVKRVTELIPALFDDILKGLPADQKPKLENLLGIWEKGNIFPAKLLSEFRAKLSGAPQVTPQTAQVSSAGKFMAPVPSRPAGTPVGYPPQQLYGQGLIVRSGDQPPQAHGMSAQQSRPPPQPQQQPQPQVQAAPPPAPAPPAQDVNSILAALAQAAPPPTAPTPSQPPPQPFMPQPQSQPQTPAAPQQQQLPPGLAALFGQQTGTQPPPPQAPQQAPQFSAPPANPPHMHMPPNFPAFPGFQGFPPQQRPPQPPPSVPQTYAMAPPPPAPQPPADPLAPLRSILPANILGDQQKLVMALNLLQDLQKQGLPMDQWGPILKAFDESQPSAPQSNGHDQYGRRRSRSPERGDRRGRASPVYGTYEEIAAKDQGQGDRSHRGGGGGRGKYRQRSPLSNMRNLQMRDSPGPAMMNGTMMQPKYIAIDSSLPPDHIKVLSRTLFVGGANGSQQEIQALFERFGRVQTCIANREKRHAFVKMTTRNNALAAKAGMEELQQRNDREVMAVARQTKWGVGFGPRECCDYTRGESVIPIYKLTDADNKWLLTAEYGGTGGKQLESGMVLEEPDIEIGAGVSSKAMSKRVMPDAGPPSKRQREEEGGSGHHHGGGGGRGHGGGKKGKRHHQHDYDAQPAQNYGGYSGVTGGAPMPMEAYGYARPEPVAVATPPAVPTFGFSLPGQGGPPYQ